MQMVSPQVSSPSASSPVSSLIRKHSHIRPVIISVGSPALAAYSLVLTSLNTRSVYRRASRVSHGSRAAVAAALISLQQLPLELTQDERLFASIPISDWWKQEIGDRLSRRETWSLATATSIACVIIVSTFALVDSLASLSSFDSVGGSYDGHVVGTAWLCLLCLVVGWMWVPGLDSDKLETALYFANQQAVRRATKEFRKAGEAAKRFINLPRERLVNRSVQGVGNRGNSGDAGREPNQNFDLGANLNGREDINGVGHVVEGSPILQDQMDPETDQLLILKDLGSLNRDERRPSVTFNYSRTLRYLALVDDVFGTLDKLTRGRDVVGLLRKCLMSEVVSLVFIRRGLPLGLLPLCSRRRMCSLRAHSPQCSRRRSWPSFSSVGQPLGPRSS